MSTETLVRYHASTHEFVFPDYDAMQRNKTGHDNGALGLWVSVRSDWIEGFGDKLYEVEFSGKQKDLGVAQLAAWSRQHEGSEHYEAVRKQVLEEGISYLRLVELDGSSAMGVVVDFGAITAFRRLSEPQPRPVKLRGP